MPSNESLTVVTTGIGITVAAGIFTGLYYIMCHGLKKKRTRNSTPTNPTSSRWNCGICGKFLRSIDGILEPEAVIACPKCGRTVCTASSCARIDPTTSIRICRNCSQPRPSTFDPFEFFKRIFTMHVDDLMDEEKCCRIEIRDFIEKSVETMLGNASIDDVSIVRLYADEGYVRLYDKYHKDLCEALAGLGAAFHVSVNKKSTKSYQFNVKDFHLRRKIFGSIGRQIDEFLNKSPLPPKILEMFLTIILSVLLTLWIIFSAILYFYHYFIEVVLDLPLIGQSPTNAHAALKRLIHGLIKEANTLDEFNQSVNNVEINSNRTYEDLLATAIINKVVSNCQDTSSVGSLASSRKLGKEYFFGEETLENKWKNGGADPDTTSISSLEEWMHSDSSSTTKYVDKVSLTIQQRIEEISQSGSDADEADDEDFEYFRHRQHVDEDNWYLKKRRFRDGHSPVPVPMLVPNPTTEAKVLIGEKVIDDTSDLSDAASGYGDPEEVADVKNLLLHSRTLIGGKNVVDHLSDHSDDSGVREDDGAKADVTVDDENIDDTSLNSHLSEKDTEYTERYASLPRTITKNDDNYELIDENNEFNGNYSKKEKAKWMNPIEMKNNPYSKENIEKRIKIKNNLFGRDYYARQASLPSGARRKDEDHENVAADWLDVDTFHAVPTKILEDEAYNSIEDKPDNSDSDISLINCYDVETSQIYRKSPETTATPPIVQPRTAKITPQPTKRQLSEMKTTPINRKLDNTLIRKIYSDPIVRNFALNKQTVESDSEIELVLEQVVENHKNIQLKSQEFHQTFSLDLSDDEVMQRQNSIGNPEISELKEKRLVANVLGQFSRSTSNLDQSTEKYETAPIERKPIGLLSVKDLKKKFEINPENHRKDKPIYSLTARSISKPFREQLKNQNENSLSASPSEVEIVST